MFDVNQQQHVRVLMHRFRACSPGHQDRYHDECARCLLIESNVDNCLEATHVKDAGGRCLTCEMFDSRKAGLRDEPRLLQLIRNLGRKD